MSVEGIFSDKLNGRTRTLPESLTETKKKVLTCQIFADMS